MEPHEVAKALSHPLRIRILLALAAPRARYSPAQLARTFGESAPNVSYHLKTLATLGAVAADGESERRGAIEHHYRLSTDDGLTQILAAFRRAFPDLA